MLQSIERGIQEKRLLVEGARYFDLSEHMRSTLLYISICRPKKLADNISLDIHNLVQVLEAKMRSSKNNKEHDHY